MLAAFFTTTDACAKVGSSESDEYDQLLDSVLVGPIPRGTNKFEIRSNAPDHTKIPAKDLIGVTVILIEGFYREDMFLRVGYYVSTEYVGQAPMPAPPKEEGMDIENSEGEEDNDEEEDDAEETENKPMDVVDPAVAVKHINIADVKRNILADKPRVTCLPIDWGSGSASM